MTVYAKDREEVIKALKACFHEHTLKDLGQPTCLKCIYFKGKNCIRHMHSDALELLNNQTKLIEEAYDKGWSEGREDLRIEMEENADVGL